ncbi:AG2 protein [Streptomyces viridosporus ATCC 14672]|uniref:AG2 protein n=1 Tax=Streptomyces viridosporus (strain ATCC 14672 / DSM 40746 / JCM 4963 / KCTC 9882 / NRRL B-12104 / FH 1290) TaxID=566461 RepID=D6A0K0_STRV1|nr:hypothetical protein [Streptomyces viridosporus]EFE67421.1 AG2 protein [Streptomyces viridosporus ATCC 14672]
MELDTLRDADFSLLDEAVTDWSTLVKSLEELKKDAEDNLHKGANKADWAGVNAKVSKEFIGKTAGEFADAHTQAKSIYQILSDTVGELKRYRRQLVDAIEVGRKKNLTVIGHEGGFTVTTNAPPEARGAMDQDNEGDITALRDEIQGILDKATESDNSARTVLQALADQSELGFSDASYADRDSAAEALKQADQLAALAKKDPDDLTVKDFDRINAGLKKYAGDELFAERFATTLGPKKTLEFWAGISDPNRGNWELGRDRLDQFDDLQRSLGLTLANATQSDSAAMTDWKRTMIDIGDKPVYGNQGGPMGFQVMSNLMRTGDYDDRFLKDYGTKLMATERKLTGNGEHPNFAWRQGPATPWLNRIGEDSGTDPLTGYLKGLSNSPDAATDFFNQRFISKDDPDNPFERDTDGNGRKGKVSLSNFQYLFEERDWPQESDSKGEDLHTGQNNLALALEAATTGHPAGEMPTDDTPAHSAEQAKLMESIVHSVSEKPSRLTDNGYMSDSMGQIAAEYMPDINRQLLAGTASERELFPIAGSAANPSEQDLTRFLYTVGRNPEGYTAVNLGQHSYTTHLMEHHFQNPDSYAKDDNFPQNERLKQGIDQIARNAGQIEGIIGAGRAYEGEVEGGAKDAEYNAALEKASAWGGTVIGIGVGLGTASTTGPGGVIAGEVAGTAAEEIIGAITSGSMKDSSDEVIYRNGSEFQATRDSTYKMVEEAARKAGGSSGQRYPLIEASVGASAENGFNSARTKVHDYLEGEGVPRALENTEG